MIVTENEKFYVGLNKRATFRWIKPAPMNVLVTGATGTLGQALVRRLLGVATRIVVYSRGEHLQEQMARDFNHHPSLRFFIGDVRDYDRLSMAMKGIDTVFHAAALKIVPIIEYNPFEAIHTNILGAENVIKAAIRSGTVRKVMAVSTDKAVSPTNSYGATKMVAEKLFVAANNLSGVDGPAFSVVRYGNVVGSRGSVIPYFKGLHALGKPLSITDPKMTRFWITLEQAVDFILASLESAKGRDIFIPKLPSVRVTEIATAINGDSPPPEIIGIRPGEKIHEVLLSDMESLVAKDEPKRYVITPLDTVPVRREPFWYSSEYNHHWLTVDEIKQAIA